MRKTLSVSIALVGVLLAASPVHAHHAFAAEYDGKKQVHLEGVVTQMEWINPHTWIHIDVTDADGKVTSWMIEGGSPNILLRRGFTKKSLEPGTEIVVQGYMAKSGENKVNGGSVVFPDGKQLFLGGSNPDELPPAK